MAKSKKPLTKRQRSLVTAGAILAALILVVAVLFVLPSAEQPEESESSSKVEGIRIYGFDAKEMDNIHVENAFCEYTIDIFTDTYDNGEEYAGGNIRELKDVTNIDTTSIGNLVYYGIDLFARQIITDDLSRKAEFGLDDPEIVLTYNFKDGSKDELLLGAVDASAIGRYVLYNDTIYLAYDAAIGLYAKNLTEYVSAGISPEYNAEEDADVAYKYFNFSGKRYPTEILVTFNADAFNQDEYVLNTSTYDLVYGDIKKTASMDAVDQRFVNILNRTAIEIVEIAPDEATLAEYGLDEPYAQIDYALFTDATYTDANEYFIKITEPKDGLSYAVNQTGDAIYLMEIAVNDVFTMEYNEIVNKMSLIPLIAKVEEISYKTPDGEYVFTLEHFTKDDGKDDITVESNGQNIIPDYFRTLYTSTIGITASEYLDIDEVPKTSTLGEPVLEATIKYIDGGRADDVISIYKGPALRYYVAYNGQVDFLTQNTKVDLVLGNITKVLNNEKPEF